MTFSIILGPAFAIGDWETGGAIAGLKETAHETNNSMHSSQALQGKLHSGFLPQRNK